MTVDVIANYQEDHPAGTSFKSMSFNPTDPVTGAVLGDGDPNTGAALVPGAGFEGGAALGLDREVWGVTGIVRAELSDSFTLTSISAYREFDSVEILDADGISLAAITAAADERGQQASQELRLTYDNDGPVTAFVGLVLFQRGRLAAHAGAVRRAGAARPPRRRAQRRRPDPGPAGQRSGADRPVRQSRLHRRAAAGRVLSRPARQMSARSQLAPPRSPRGIAANLKANHTETTTNTSETEAFDIFGGRHLPSLRPVRDRRRRALRP